MEKILVFVFDFSLGDNIVYLERFSVFGLKNILFLFYWNKNFFFIVLVYYELGFRENRLIVLSWSF